MKLHDIGYPEWYRLNELVKSVGCDWPLYLVENESVFCLVCWVSGPKDKPLWFATEYSPEDEEKYYEEKTRALSLPTTLFRNSTSVS